MKLKSLMPLMAFCLALALLNGCDNRTVKTLLMVDEKAPELPKIWEGMPEPQARVIKAAGANAGQIRGFIENYEEADPRREAAMREVARLCLADAAGLSIEDLVYNLDGAYAAREAAPWGSLLPEDLFADFVVPHRVGKELFRPWRGPLGAALTSRLVGLTSIPEAVAAVRLWVFEHARFKVSQDYVAAAVDTVSLGHGSSEELAVLLTCALRAACVPARLGGYTSGLVEYWDGQWRMVNAMDASDLPREALDEADARREFRLRELKGAALGWMAAQRKLACSREDAGRVLTSARGNWKQVAAYLLAIPGYRSEGYCVYATRLSDNELSALRPDTALDNVRMALDASGATPDKEHAWEAFVVNVLPNRIADEAPSMWRGPYTSQFRRYRLMPEIEARRVVHSWAQSLELTLEFPPGPTMTPLEIIKSGRVTSEAERGLAERAAIRALGFAD